MIIKWSTRIFTIIIRYLGKLITFMLYVGGDHFTHSHTYFTVASLTLFMMTSSNGNIFCDTCPLGRESICHRWIPLRKPVTRSFDVFFDMCLKKRLSKQWKRQWFETPSRSLWCYCNIQPYMCMPATDSGSGVTLKVMCKLDSTKPR